MTIARMHIVDAHSPGAYHVVTRCVRQAFLCGRDRFTGRDFSHRKRWIEERLFALAECFSIAVYAYAVMSNHVHLVVQTDPDAPRHWDAVEVLRRWFTVSRRRGESDEARQQRIDAAIGNEALVAKYRERLGSLSTFMQFLNESIARAANAEDGCKGRFWDGRFRCQALLDESAVLSGMVYVDLNPVRAGVVDKPEAAEHVSVRRRFDAMKKAGPGALLMPVAGDGPARTVGEREYLELVDATGRMLRADKPGSISRALPPILMRLGLSERAWLGQVRGTQSCYWRVIGSLQSFVAKADALGQRWLKGCGFAKRLSCA